MEPSGAEMVVGDVRLDLARQRVVVGERVVLLSKTEVALLRELMASPGGALSPEELLARVWGPQYRGDTEIVRTNIYRLRRKLNAGNFLQSRPGVGYFVTSPTPPSHRSSRCHNSVTPGPPGLGANWLYRREHCTDGSLC